MEKNELLGLPHPSERAYYDVIAHEEKMYENVSLIINDKKIIIIDSMNPKELMIQNLCVDAAGNLGCQIRIHEFREHMELWETWRNVRLVRK